MIKRLLVFGIALVALLALPVGASAQVSLDGSSGIWAVAQPGGTVSGLGTNLIQWGTPVYYRQSAYLFQGTAPPPVPVSLNTDFTLGTFTHFNYPITGQSLSAATLDLSIDVTIDGQSFTDLAFNYQFLHNETPNNSNHPEDIVTFINPGPSDELLVGNQAYILEIVGFQVGGNIVDQFITSEKAINNASLIGRVTAVQIPEPATYLTLGTLLLLAVAAKRRAKNLARSLH